MESFREIEVKFNASAIKIEDFKRACESMGAHKILEVESYDHYYTQGQKAIRHREGEIPELTIKQKLTSTNNFRRIEINLKVSEKAKSSEIAEFCKLLGYKHNFSIYKHSTIFLYPGYNTVYYVIYADHTKQKEIGRFIEIEMDEDGPWPTADVAWEALLTVEKHLAFIGIKSQKRIKKSLLEMFRRR